MAEAVWIVLLLLWVNFLPAAASALWGHGFEYPVDNGAVWFDGRRLFGGHKTGRGVLTAFGGALLVSPLLPLPLDAVLITALLAMAGDLLTSFGKRRLGLEPGHRLAVLDQLLEGLLPLLYLTQRLPLSWPRAAAILLIFIPITHGGSLLWGYLLSRPAATGYPRLIRSSVRVREWRACHLPLARWHRLFNFERFIFYRLVISYCFKMTGLYRVGLRNALAPRLEERHFDFADLPPRFDGFKIMLLTDLHLDGIPELTATVIELVRDQEVDLCLLGGDIRMETYGTMRPALRHLKRLMAAVRSRHGIFAVLGNHDCIEMVPDCEDCGVVMLINESWRIDLDGAAIWLAGVDDPHYYRTHDPALACKKIPPGAFTIFLAHSPEAAAEAAPLRPQLYLCGHTHGGQIRLPGRGPLFTNSRSPRYMAEGCWQLEDMRGYTSRGVGASGVPLRFNCPGEVTLITLRHKGKITTFR